MAVFLSSALNNGSLWAILACLVVFAGVVLGMYTRSGSEISSHPYAKGGDGGELGTDPPSGASGREELEPLLSPLRAGRRARRHRS